MITDIYHGHSYVGLARQSLEICYAAQALWPKLLPNSNKVSLSLRNPRADLVIAQ